MNNLVFCPCKDCKKRTITCHGECADYKEYTLAKKRATKQERIVREWGGTMKV